MEQKKININLFEVSQKVDITPDIASKILAKNEVNRNLNNNVIKFYVEQMNNNNWFNYSPEPIIINRLGFLLDGQHRLNAVIKSNKTIGFNIYIVEDINLKPMDLMVNCGLKRSLSNLTNINAYHVSVINYIMRILKGNIGATPIEIKLFYEKYIKNEPFLLEILSKHKTPFWCSADIKSIFLTYYYKSDEDRKYVVDLISYFFSNESNSPQILQKAYIRYSQRPMIRDEKRKLVDFLFNFKNSNSKLIILTENIKPIKQTLDVFNNFREVIKNENN